MSRERLFDSEPVPGISGLTTLTAPPDDEAVSAVVDVAVIGARSDGKTQLIAHAIRTLRAYAPTGLDPEEVRQNQDILQVVMNARDPRPDATVPGRVQHYVFRARPEGLLGSVGWWRAFGLVARNGTFLASLLLALLNAAAIAGALAWQARSPVDPIALGAGGVALALGAVASLRLARRRFIRRGDVEVVFWDVAGEHVYSGSASGYYTLLSTLAQTRAASQPARRKYGFAPVLVCNPLGLGTSANDSPYARLRRLMPLFAALGDPPPPVLVAVNRWSLVQALCLPGADVDERVAVAPIARDDDVAPTEGSVHNEALPVVVRDVVRQHCLDAEVSELDGVQFETIHYEAGMHATATESAWTQYNDLSSEIRARFAPPVEDSIDRVVQYEYAEGPGAFEGATRRIFLRWLTGLPRRPRVVAESAEDARTAANIDDETLTRLDSVRAESREPRPRPARSASDTAEMYAVGRRGTSDDLDTEIDGTVSPATVVDKPSGGFGTGGT